MAAVVDAVENKGGIVEMAFAFERGWLAGKPFPTATGVVLAVPHALSTDAVAGMPCIPFFFQPRRPRKCVAHH